MVLSWIPQISDLAILAGLKLYSLPPIIFFYGPYKLKELCEEIFNL